MNELTKRPQMTSRTIATGSLHASDFEEIWQFMRRFVRRDRVAFERALRATSFVVLARDKESGSLVGFIAQRLLHVAWRGAPVTVLYTAWTAIDRAYRGRLLPHQSNLVSYLRLRRLYPWRRLYLMFAASTFKSYRVLPRVGAIFWPLPDKPMPEREASIVDQVMSALEEPGWDPERGIIHRHGATRYLEGVVADEPAAVRDPLVRYYAERNPLQEQGDTLVCIAPMSLWNWTRVALGAGAHAAVGKRRLRLVRRVALRSAPLSALDVAKRL